MWTGKLPQYYTRTLKKTSHGCRSMLIFQGYACIHIIVGTNMQSIILYGNIDQTLLNQLHGPTHCKIGDTCIYSGHVFYTLV